MLMLIRNSLIRLEARVLQILGTHSNQGWPPLSYELAVAEGPLEPPPQSKTKSILDAILGDGFLWAVPKRRRSLERRMTRRMGKSHFLRSLTPKKNIVECLECGHWHEAHTICGNCYSKVRTETEIMQNSMPEEDRLTNIPRTEVVYLYKGEEQRRSQFQGKYIVEVEKPRPEWWPKNLLTKAHRP